MTSWLKSRKKTTPKSSDTNHLIKPNGCLNKFNFCFNQSNMIDCEAISDESEDQPNANTNLTNNNYKTTTTLDEVATRKSSESASKSKSYKSRGSESARKNPSYSVKCKNAIHFLLNWFWSRVWTSIVTPRKSRLDWNPLN